MKKKTIKGYRTDETTNIRLEMIAVLKALKVLKSGEPQQINIHTNNSFIARSPTEWLSGWIENGWRTKQGKQVQNSDLWEAILSATRGKEVVWHWIKNRADDPLNADVRSLARQQMENARSEARGLLFAA